MKLHLNLIMTLACTGGLCQQQLDAFQRLVTRALQTRPSWASLVTGSARSKSASLVRKMAVAGTGLGLTALAAPQPIAVPPEGIASVTIRHECALDTERFVPFFDADWIRAFGLRYGRDESTRGVSNCETTVGTIYDGSVGEPDKGINLPLWAYAHRSTLSFWQRGKQVVRDHEFNVGTLRAKMTDATLETTFVPHTSKLVQEGGEHMVYFRNSRTIGRPSMRSVLQVSDRDPQMVGTMYVEPSLTYTISDPTHNTVFSHTVRPTESADGERVELQATITEAMFDNPRSTSSDEFTGDWQNRLHVHIAYPTRKKCQGAFMALHGIDADKLDTFGPHMKKCTTTPLFKHISPNAKVQ